MSKSEWRRGMLQAARIASQHSRQMLASAHSRREKVRKLRRAGKNIHSGENSWAFNSESRMYGYFFDRYQIAKSIAADIRKAVRESR